MKIALNVLAVGAGMTGIGSYARSLVDSLVRYGGKHEYIFLTGPHFTSLPLEEKKNLRQIIVGCPDSLWEQLHLPTELSGWGVDWYHSPLFTCPIVDEIPSIITIHDVIPEVRPDLCSAKFLNFYRERIGPSVRAAVKIVTTSEFSRREIIEYLKVEPEKVQVIYQGIAEKFSPTNKNRIAELSNKLHLPEKYILYVGIIERRKNIAGLIKAFEQLAQEITDVSLVLAGRYDEDHSVQDSWEKSQFKERIHVVGYVSDDDLPVLYAGARVFAFPSLYEGFGRPVIEAMASEVPVVASNGSALPEIVGDAALLCDPNDTSGMAEALRQACENQTIRQNLIAKGKQRAALFTLRKFAERILEFYASLGENHENCA